MTPATDTIAGYDFGKASVPRSPVTLEELRQIEDTLGWTPDDAQALAEHSDIFVTQAESMVDAWRGVIATQPHLMQSFQADSGATDDQYRSRVKKRFVQWVIDASSRPSGQAWLDYQEEIGERHTPIKKNQTDDGHTVNVVPLRFVLAFHTTMVTTTRPFFVYAGLEGDDLRCLEEAWSKTVLLHLIMWTRPYTKDGWW